MLVQAEWSGLAAFGSTGAGEAEATTTPLARLGDMASLLKSDCDRFASDRRAHRRKHLEPKWLTLQIEHYQLAPCNGVCLMSMFTKMMTTMTTMVPFVDDGRNHVAAVRR